MAEILPGISLVSSTDSLARTAPVMLRALSSTRDSTAITSTGIDLVSAPAAEGAPAAAESSFKKDNLGQAIRNRTIRTITTVKTVLTVLFINRRLFRR